MRFLIFFLILTKAFLVFGNTRIVETFFPSSESSICIIFEVFNDKIVFSFEFKNISDKKIVFNDSWLQTGSCYNIINENNKNGILLSPIMLIEYDFRILDKNIIRLQPEESKIYNYEFLYTYENNALIISEGIYEFDYNRKQFLEPKNIYINIYYYCSEDYSKKIFELVGDIVQIPDFRRQYLLFNFE